MRKNSEKNSKIRKFSEKKYMYGPPCLPAKDTSSVVSKENEKLRDKQLDSESYCGPRSRRGKEILVYRLIVKSSPPRKSLVKGERFVSDEGNPE